jgi:wyosine [tRNA(Phe)-imidazoG37] synthetase (radical SAM superfamily)
MGGFLFHQLVFGPLQSRRMGSSLGVNLLPLDHKRCSFNCIYCECGWTPQRCAGEPDNGVYPPPDRVAAALETRLEQLRASGVKMPDAITFAGNGEPTLHPKFAEVIDRTIAARNTLSPTSKIVVLSNGSTLKKPAVFDALNKVEMNIQKLDGGSNATLLQINQPENPAFDTGELVEELSRFNGKVIIQTLFLRGIYHGIPINNTTAVEVEEWIRHLKKIGPQYVMIYPVDRGTPARDILKIPLKELEQIAARAEAEGISTKVYF